MIRSVCTDPSFKLSNLVAVLQDSTEQKAKKITQSIYILRSTLEYAHAILFMALRAYRLDVYFTQFEETLLETQSAWIFDVRDFQLWDG